MVKVQPTREAALNTLPLVSEMLEHSVANNPAIPAELQARAQKLSDEVGELYQAVGALE